MNDFDDDQAVQDALGSIQENCPQMLSADKGFCKKPVSIILVNHSNLVCNRLLVATCTDGHKQLSAIIEE